MSLYEHGATPGGWEWPASVPAHGKAEPSEDIDASLHEDMPAEEPGGFSDTSKDGDPKRTPSAGEPKPGQKRSRTHWPPRTCRICLETVQPTFNTQNESLPRLFQSAPDVTYESEEGRLIRPCKCKGSQRYVHEGCLQAWRHADRFYGKRNYWQCPTCSFRYRLDRMSWSRMITSAFAQIFLTVLILVVVVFFVGFIGDFVLDLYFDPWGTLAGYRSNTSFFDDEPPTWAEHFMKGVASLGVLSCAKLLFSPSRFIFHRTGGGRRAARDGRDRMADVSMIMVAFGIATFLWSVWKGTRALTRRYLTKVAERVLDVQGDDDGDDDD